MPNRAQQGRSEAENSGNSETRGVSLTGGSGGVITLRLKQVLRRRAPLSAADGEFLFRFVSPATRAAVMNDQAIVAAIKDIIKDIAPDEDGVEELNPAERLRDQMDLDSMDFLDIVLELRKRYSVEVPEEDYKHLATLDSCVEYLRPKMAHINA